jgi:phage FluMu gp28-like protein
VASSLEISEQEWARLRAEAAHPMPVIPTGGGLPDVLISYQAELHRKTAAHRVVVVEKSRRTGFTWGVAADAVLTSAAARTAGGMDTFYIGYNLEMAREFIDTCGMWAKAFNQAAMEVEEFVFKDQSAEGDKDIQAFRIRFASGFEIVALASRPRSLRGKQGYVIIDEAAFHDDLAALMKAAMALLMWGGKVLVISTHDGADNAFNELVEEIKKGRKPFALMTVDFDEALRQGLYQRICLVKGETWSPEAEAAWRSEMIAFYGEDADEELFVIPRQGGGAYIPALLLEQSQIAGIPVIQWEKTDEFARLSKELRLIEVTKFCEEQIKPHLSRLDPARNSYLGKDVARTRDVSVDWPLQRMEDMRLVPPFIVELRTIPFDVQRHILWYIIRALPNCVAAVIDATGNGSQIAEETQQEFGFDRITALKISDSYYELNMPRWKAAFEDHRVGTPRNDDVYRDHRAVKNVNGVPKVPKVNTARGKGEDAKGGKSTRRHGDTAIANFLGFMASQIEIAPIDFQSVPPREGYSDFSGGSMNLGGFQ